MKSFSSRNLLWFLTLSAALAAAGCHSNSQNAGNSTQAPQQQYTADPASANVAPVASGGTSAGEYQPAGQAAPVDEAEDQAYSQQESELPPSQDSADEQAYGIQPQETAPQPPPPLPDYDQPPCPGDNYIWTPGYWYYAPAGYYWVPGAWVEAPFTGALWTPGYWVFANGRYDYFHGYWGQYVGFYGGIDYGFGYTGFGYRGGFWRGGTFNYNRTVNNINVSVVHNYYNYRISGNGSSRISFNGGQGGIQARPRVAELAALREPRVAPMNTQVQLRQQAMTNHAQFAQANHGRPAQAAFARPVAAEHGLHPVAQTVRNLPAGARIAPETASNARPASAQQRTQINREGPPRTAEHQPEPVYPETNRPPQRYGQPMRSQATAGEPTRPRSNMESPSRAARPQQPNHPAEVRQQPNRPQQTHTEPMHTEPGRAVAAHPEPSRSAPSRPASHPQPERKAAPERHEEHK